MTDKTIEKGSVVSFHYRLHDEQGELIEESYAADPVLYLHGKNNILPAMEEALLSKKTGDKIGLTVSPEQGYGEYNPESVQRVSIKKLVGKGGKIKVGDVIAVDTDKGQGHVRVIKVGKFNADVDTNHPLAGKTLKFDMEVLEIRDATKDELAHGHAHGAGGHQH